MRRFLPAVIPLLLAGCAAGAPTASAPTASAPAHTVRAQPNRYQVTATVLQSREHGPELCLEPMGSKVAEHPGEFVLNVAFTGDLARHRAELRPQWGGRLCVTRQQRSYHQLLRVQRELQGATAADLGLQVLDTGIDEYANAVDLRVVVLDTRARKAIDQRYGAGAVQATAALTPAA